MSGMIEAVLNAVSLAIAVGLFLGTVSLRRTARTSEQQRR
jgi:hypothetical protein